MKYQDRKGKSFIKPFTPKRPVKSFLDLDVYQRSLAVCVAVVKNISGQQELHDLVLAIPRLIATAHSLRFSDHARAIAVLEDCMLKCNLAVVYLEQYRDLYQPSADIERPDAEVETKVAIVPNTSNVIPEYSSGIQTEETGSPVKLGMTGVSDAMSGGTAPEGNGNVGIGATNSALGRIGLGFFEEQIKNLLSLRMKIMRLQISWKKFSSFDYKE
ncbi:hypothetical protein GW916_15710 [bacterium]|nr:hypothetical protein [bacterium]